MNRIGFDTRLEYAWAAGLFDGEGSVCFTNPKDRPNPRIYLSLSMTCEESVRKFHEIVEVGTIIYRDDYIEKGYKPQWRWSVESSPKVAEFAKRLGPYLVTKQDKFNEALEHWHNNFNPENSGNWKNILARVKEEMPHVIN